MPTAPIAEDRAAPPPEGMFRELLAIHAHLRRDLRTVRRLADEARDGLGTDAIVAEIRTLASTSPLWRLKFGCWHYCRFLHTHHAIEDAALFPMVRAHDPSLDRVVDRLAADHLAVHDITERIAAEADAVASAGTAASGDRLVGALTELEEHLLAHLSREEQALGPLLSSWDRWPIE